MPLDMFPFADITRWYLRPLAGEALASHAPWLQAQTAFQFTTPTNGWIKSWHTFMTRFIFNAAVYMHSTKLLVVSRPGGDSRPRRGSVRRWLVDLAGRLLDAVLTS